MDDIRLKELRFLQIVAKHSDDPNWLYNPDSQEMRSLELRGHLVEMVIYLAEINAVRFEDEETRRFVGFLRKEDARTTSRAIHHHEWDHPRDALRSRLIGAVHRLRITYTGLRHIEELRDALKADRILDPFGILLDRRYYYKDLRTTVERGDISSISVIGLDLDGFGTINKKYGHAAGDAAIISARTIARDVIDTFGTVYERGGDEMRALLPGIERIRAASFAESIRAAIEAMKVEHQGVVLPRVTASLGVACSPPDLRTSDLDEVADERQRKAKDAGKNRVVVD